MKGRPTGKYRMKKTGGIEFVRENGGITRSRGIREFYKNSCVANLLFFLFASPLIDYCCARLHSTLLCTLCVRDKKRTRQDCDLSYRQDCCDSSFYVRSICVERDSICECIFLFPNLLKSVNYVFP